MYIQYRKFEKKLKLEEGSRKSTENIHKRFIKEFPWWLSGKESTCQSRSHGFNPWSGRILPATEQLSPSTTTPEATAIVTLEPRNTTQHLKSLLLRARALQQEKPHQWEARPAAKTQLS